MEVAYIQQIITFFAYLERSDSHLSFPLEIKKRYDEAVDSIQVDLTKLEAFFQNVTPELMTDAAAVSMLSNLKRVNNELFAESNANADLPSVLERTEELIRETQKVSKLLEDVKVLQEAHIHANSETNKESISE